jgi:hypothetical protein
MSSMRLSAQHVYRVLGQVVVCLAVSLPALAQVQSKTTTTQGSTTKQVTIQRGEITYVKGHTVVVKMEDGTLEQFDNVPDNLRFTVDGKPVNIRNAQVGMKLEKQTITTSQPQMITAVETVTGKVWRVTPPHSVILTLENGQNQQFKIPDGQKFIVEGKETDAWGLRKSMTVSAQKVTEVPVTVTTREIVRTGTAPAPVAPAPTLQPDVPLLVVVPAPPVNVKPPVESAQVESAPTTLPATASYDPIWGLLGLVFCSLGLMLKAARIIASRFVNSRS